MSYVDYSFLFFLLCSLGLYFLMPKQIRKYVIFISSLIFYAFAGIDNFLFVGISMVSTYIASRFIERLHDDKKRKRVLWITLLLNLGILLILKYGDFSLSILAQVIPIEPYPQLSLWIPLGISFYTLQVISYVVDVYRKKIKAEKNIFKYASFVLYFPTILQGPITRYHDMANQLWAPHSFDYERVKFGGQLMVWGLFKKLVIANHLAVYVDQVFNEYSQYSGILVLLACIFYAFQIYTDFSGCVDICRGISQMYGITLPDNFNHPYFATSVQDFWRRWHISLSSWFRDYIYIPLGGNKKGMLIKYRNILIVFFVSGLWHGVGYHYIVWGLLHGVYQIIGAITLKGKQRLAKRIGYPINSSFHHLVKMGITLVLITFAWVFFRAPNTLAAIQILASIPHNFFAYHQLYEIGITLREFILMFLCIPFLCFISYLQTRISIRKEISKLPLPIRWTLYLIALYAIIIFGLYGSGFDSSSFIYLQF